MSPELDHCGNCYLFDKIEDGGGSGKCKASTWRLSLYFINKGRLRELIAISNPFGREFTHEKNECSVFRADGSRAMMPVIPICTDDEMTCGDCWLGVEIPDGNKGMKCNGSRPRLSLCLLWKGRMYELIGFSLPNRAEVTADSVCSLTGPDGYPGFIGLDSISVLGPDSL